MVNTFICSPLSTGFTYNRSAAGRLFAIKFQGPSWEDPRVVHVEQISAIPGNGHKKSRVTEIS
jgi:hypothetical protein